MFDEQSGVLLMWWGLLEWVEAARRRLYARLQTVQTHYRVSCVNFGAGCDRATPWRATREAAAAEAKGYGLVCFPYGTRPFAACPTCLRERLTACSGARTATGALEGGCPNSERIGFCGERHLWSGWIERERETGSIGPRFACAACAARDTHPETSPEAS